MKALKQILLYFEQLNLALLCLSLRLITPHLQTIEHDFRFRENVNNFSFYAISIWHEAKRWMFFFGLVFVCFHDFDWTINPISAAHLLCLYTYVYRSRRKFVLGGHFNLARKTKTNGRCLQAGPAFVLTLLGACLLPADVKIQTWRCTSCCSCSQMFFSLTFFPWRSIRINSLK